MSFFLFKCLKYEKLFVFLNKNFKFSTFKIKYIFKKAGKVMFILSSKISFQF